MLPSPTLAMPTPARTARRPVAAWLLGLLGVLALLCAILASICVGLVGIPPVEALRALVSPSAADVQTAAIIWSIRLPRTVVAVIVGGALAGVGVALQAVFRNPLADPGVTGVSAGAAVGAVSGITLGLAGSLQWGVPLAACAGALVVALILQAVIQLVRSASPHTLILVGVAINAFAGAIIAILIANAHDDALVRGAMFWLAGDLDLRTWSHAAIAVVPAALGLALLLFRTRALDALLLGDDVAETSGFDAARTRLLLLLITSLITGAAVAVSGVIAFVGLVVPHAVRLVLGGRHARLLPVSILCGALFLLIADALARTAFGEVAVQTGAVCAVIGAPVFLLLLLARRRG